MTMLIRPAEPADAGVLVRLWATAFPGERSVAERERMLEEGLPYGGIESAWLHEERGRPVAAFRAYRMTQYISGNPLAMLGLAAVAVHPAARRRGIGRAICLQALRVGRERGDVISTLYPFRPGYYASMGWGLVGGLHAHTFRAGALPEEEWRSIRIAEPGDRDAIIESYGRTAARSNGLLHRSDGAWRFRLDPILEQDAADRFAIVFDRDGVRGYLLARSRDRRSPERRTLRVLELIAEDDDAYRGLLGWVAGQRDQWPIVRYDASPRERLEQRLADPRPPGYRHERGLWFPTARLLRGPMLRVLDVPAALQAREWKGVPEDGLPVEIEIVDTELPANRGPWRLELHRRGTGVIASGEGRPAARLATDAPTFAQMFAGELLPSEAARLGLAEVQATRALDDAFRPLEPFWLLDEF